MLSEYAVLTLPVGHSPALQEWQHILLNKGLDSVTPSDAHVLPVFFFFFMLNLDAFLWSRCQPHYFPQSFTYPLYSFILFARPLKAFGFVTLGFNANFTH